MLVEGIGLLDEGAYTRLVLTLGVVDLEVAIGIKMVTLGVVDGTLFCKVIACLKEVVLTTPKVAGECVDIAVAVGDTNGVGVTVVGISVE